MYAIRDGRYRERDSKSRGDDPVVVVHGGVFQLGEEARGVVVGHIRCADHRDQDEDRVARLLPDRIIINIL